MNRNFVRITAVLLAVVLIGGLLYLGGNRFCPVIW